MASTADFNERQIPVEWLAKFSWVMAGVLGEFGWGSVEVEQLITEGTHAECVTCHAELTGAELISLGLGVEGHDASMRARLRRLRLGYCVARGCGSRYYLVRFLGRPGFDWNEVWARAYARFGSTERKRAEGPGSDLVWWRSWVPLERLSGFSKSHILGVLGVAVVLAGVLGGCKVRSLLNPARVFIVSSAASERQEIRLSSE